MTDTWPLNTIFITIYLRAIIEQFLNMFFKEYDLKKSTLHGHKIVKLIFI